MYFDTCFDWTSTYFPLKIDLKICNVRWVYCTNWLNVALFSWQIYSSIFRFHSVRVTNCLGLAVISSSKHFTCIDYMLKVGMIYTYIFYIHWYFGNLLISGFLWSGWRGKRSRHYRRLRNPQFYVSGKRPMATDALVLKQCRCIVSAE